MIYFEAGHGKGPRDGLGGTTKRMADEAIRQRKTTIQDLKEFYRRSLTSNIKEVSFIFLDKDACETKRAERNIFQIIYVKDMVKLHANVGLSLRQTYLPKRQAVILQ